MWQGGAFVIAGCRSAARVHTVPKTYTLSCFCAVAQDMNRLSALMALLLPSVVCVCCCLLMVITSSMQIQPHTEFCLYTHPTTQHQPHYSTCTASAPPRSRLTTFLLHCPKAASAPIWHECLRLPLWQGYACGCGPPVFRHRAARSHCHSTHMLPGPTAAQLLRSTRCCRGLSS